MRFAEWSNSIRWSPRVIRRNTNEKAEWSISVSFCLVWRKHWWVPYFADWTLVLSEDQISGTPNWKRKGHGGEKPQECLLALEWWLILHAHTKNHLWVHLRMRELASAYLAIDAHKCSLTTFCQWFSKTAHQSLLHFLFSINVESIGNCVCVNVFGYWFSSWKYFNW